MAGDHIDEVFVDIKPDAHGFGRELDSELTPALHRIEDKFDRLIESLEDGFERLIAQVEIASDQLASSVDDSLDDIRHDVRRTADAIGIDFELGTGVAKHAVDDLADSADHDFDRIRRKSRSSGDETGRGFLGGIIAAISGAGSNLSGALGGALSGIGSSLGGGGDITSLLKVAAITAAIPAVIALAGALSQLIGLLALIPASLGVVIAAIAPLVIAFQGFGDAIGAGFSGDVEKFNKALKGLAPSAQSVVKEIVGLKDQFKAIKASVQQAFFAPLVGTFKALGTTLLPVLNKGLTTVASALGKLVAGILQLLSSAPVVNTINLLFAATGRIIDAFAPAAQAIFSALFSTMQAGLPFVEKMFTTFAKATQQFANWADASTQGSKFTGWITDAIRVVGELWNLIKQGGQLLGTIFGGPDIKESGESLIDSLSKAIAKLDAFFKSAKGQETLLAIAKAARFVGAAIVWLAEAFAWTAGAINTLVHWIVNVIDWFGKWPGAISSAWNAVVGFFSAIGSGIAGAATAFFNWIVNIVVWLQQLPGKVLAALAALPSMMINFFWNTLNQVAFAVGFAIGAIIKFFIDLPGRIWGALQALPGLIMGVFTSAWNFAKNTTMNALSTIVGIALGLPGRVRSAIYGLISTLAGIVKSAWDGAVRGVTSGVSAAVNAAKQLPGRIKSALSGAASWLFGIGQDVVRGLGRGIESMLGWVKDKASQIAKSAINGAKSALGIGSPSKEFAKLGVWSVKGYQGGWEKSMPDAAADMAQTIKMPVDMFKSAARSSQSTTATAAPTSGGVNFTAYLKIGDEQLHPVVVTAIAEHPQEVALAAEDGDSRLARRR